LSYHSCAGEHVDGKPWSMCKQTIKPEPEEVGLELDNLKIRTAP